jgi:7-carboxy-7-deazaguanine synthase (Cx14CxxC type)
MTYTVKEIFKTIQGEGAWLGTPAIFIRFAGCNLWSGREEDRKSAVCQFCDTDFVGGAKFATAAELVDVVAEIRGQVDWVVLTGGEPGLQVDEALLAELHDRDFLIATETNGTVGLPRGIDWICVSPKTRDIKQTSGNQLKLVFPQDAVKPEDFIGMGFMRFTLSPKDDANLKQNTAAAIAYCMENPAWSLTIQAHKVWGIR